METPLSPLDFARRARRLYADREAVVDGEHHFTYREFFERCDRWSSALQKLGVQPGDRVATIAPNTHAHLEAFYALPQIGAVIVPINFRLTAADFAYILKHSGDAAVVHPDGYIEIRDRWKDIIISGGENISSIEVEGVLLRHPAVQEVAVVGLPHEKWGETPQAFIVLKPGTEATPEALRLFCREHLAHFKVPHGFAFIAELPKTATGKIQKYVLRGGRANIAKQ